MNAQQLKNAILQEAIEGRLVPQDPNDEPASILLERIRAEKERLVREGKLKKKDLEIKPISEDEIPFEIPESWEWCKLGWITTVLGGKRIPAGRKLSQENTGHIYIRVSDMKEDTVSTENLLYVPNDIFPSISRYIIKKENVYITVAGTIGKIGKIPFELDGANLTENADRLVFSYLNQDWLIKFLQSPEVQSQINDVTTKVGQPKLAIQRIQNLILPLPPLAEQKRIVAKIEELLPKVEAYGKAQESLDKLNEELPERLKKSILQEAIEGSLVPQDPNDEPASILLEKIRKEKARLVKEGKLKKKDLEETPISEDEKPFEIPDSWEWCRLGTITTVLGGKRIPAGRKLSQENTGHIYIRVSDMKEGTVSTDNLLYVPEDIFPSISRYIINKEDVYITVAGTIGKIGKIPAEIDGANLTENADRLVFRFINQNWLIKCLQSPIVQTQISDVTTQVGQPKLAILRIQNLLVPLPPLAEQKRIVAKIEQLMKEIDKLKV